jgi:hypothetical protein
MGTQRDPMKAQISRGKAHHYFFMTFVKSSEIFFVVKWRIGISVAKGNAKLKMQNGGFAFLAEPWRNLTIPITNRF